MSFDYRIDVLYFLGANIIILRSFLVSGWRSWNLLTRRLWLLNWWRTLIDTEWVTCVCCLLWAQCINVVVNSAYL